MTIGLMYVDYAPLDIIENINWSSISAPDIPTIVQKSMTLKKRTMNQAFRILRNRNSKINTQSHQIMMNLKISTYNCSYSSSIRP